MILLIDTKPELEWVERKDGHKFYADIYEMQQTVSGRWIIIIGGYVEKPYFETAEHGKEYAQADYERRTAERFVKVEVPKSVIPYQSDNAPYNPHEAYDTGWNSCVNALHKSIAKATEAK